jgi:hypothetical protein
MKTIRYNFVDKSEWGAGPWVKEPDKVQWRDKATGLPCLIVRNTHGTGALCGYVGVPASHSLYGKGYNDAESIRVHGGVTFADKCSPQEKEAGICHAVEAGEDDNVWWFGFDCSHAFDLCPKMEASLRGIRANKPELFPDLYAGFPDKEKWPKRWRDTYRTIRYTRGQVRQLAAQLAAMA